MKLARWSIVLASLILGLVFVLVMVYMNDITYTFSGINTSSEFEFGSEYYEFGNPVPYFPREFRGNEFIQSNGEATQLTRIIFAIVFLFFMLLMTMIPAQRIQKIEKNRTDKTGLLVAFGIVYILIGVLTIPGILLIIGANTGDRSNAEAYPDLRYKDDVYENEYRYDEEFPKNNKSQGQTDEYLTERISQVEQDLADLKRRQRKSNYDVDDEIDYMNKRHNRKFRDLEDDIEDLSRGKKTRR